MKRVVFIAICVVGLLSFSSCGSTAPCGLSKTSNQNQLDMEKAPILVSDADVE